MKHPIVQDLFTIEHFRNKTFEEKIVYQPGTHQIFLLEKAKGGLIIDGKKVLFSDNTIIVLSRGQGYSFLPNKVSGYLLQFSDSFWRRTPESANNCKAVLFDTGVVKHQLTLTHNDMETLTAVFERR